MCSVLAPYDVIMSISFHLQGLSDLCMNPKEFLISEATKHSEISEGKSEENELLIE